MQPEKSPPQTDSAVLQRARLFLDQATTAFSSDNYVAVLQATKEIEKLTNGSSDVNVLLVRGQAKFMAAAAAKAIGRAQTEVVAFATDGATIVERAIAGGSPEVKRAGYECLARGLLVLGTAYSEWGRLDDAATTMRSAIRAVEQSPDHGASFPDTRVLGQAALGAVLFRDGKLEEALKEYRDGLDSLNKLQLERPMAAAIAEQCHNGIGLILLGMGDPRGTEEFKLADEFLKDADLGPMGALDVISSRVLRANAYVSVLRPDDALAETEAGIRLVRTLPRTDETAMLRALLYEAKGDALAFLGRFAEEQRVREELLKALAGVKSEDAKRMRAVALTSIGTGLAGAGSVVEADAKLRAGMKELEGCADTPEVLQARVALFSAAASIAAWANRPDDASARLAAAARAFDAFEKVAPPEAEVNMGFRLAVAARLSGDSKVASDTMAKARGAWERLEAGVAKDVLGLQVLGGALLDSAAWSADPEGTARAADQLLRIAESPSVPVFLRNDARVWASMAKAMATWRTDPKAAGSLIQRVLGLLGDDPERSAMRSQARSIRALALMMDRDTRAQGLNDMLQAARESWTWVARNLPGLPEAQKRIMLEKVIMDPGLMYAASIDLGGASARVGLEIAILRKSLYADLARREQGAFLKLADNTWKLEWKEYCASRSALAVRTAEGASASTPDALALTKDISRLETELRDSNAAFNAMMQFEPPTSNDVAGALRDGEWLVEYVRHPGIDLSLKPGDKVSGGDRYGAFVLGRQNQVVAIDLGSAASIDQLVLQAEDLISKALRSRDFEGDDLAQTLERLRVLVWDPIAKHISGASRVFVAPESTLCRVSFDSLPIEMTTTGRYRFLTEQIQVVYVANGRQVHDRTAGWNLNELEHATLIGDPDFAANDEERTQARAMLKTRPPAGAPCESSVPRVTKDDFPFGRAPLTGEFVVRLGRRLNELHAGTAVMLTGRCAEKCATGFLAGEDLIVIATHGESERIPQAARRANDDAGRSVIDDEMLRCRLALAGANTPTSGGKSVRRGDAMLTGFEVATLDLSHAKLVVLVACETAKDTDAGHAVVGGEGVHAFPKAFWVAGAKAVVAAQWSILEGLSIEEMESFFSGMVEHGQPPAKAFHSAQLAALERARALKKGNGHPALWAGLVYFGDPGD